MKKIFAFATMLFFAVTVSAQNKPTVCVENFTNNSTLKNNLVKSMQNEIVSGLTGTGRVIVKEESNFPKLPSDPVARIEALKSEGVNFLMKGQVNTVATGTSKSALDKNKTVYTAEISYTLTLIDIESNRTVASDTEKASYNSGSTESEAILEAISNSKDAMNRYVDSHFRISATIKALDQVDPKKGAKTVYVTMGTDVGLEKGDIMEVFAEVNIAGEIAQKKIGEVKAVEVMSGTLTLCSVKDGGAEIKKAYDEGTAMSVVSRPKKKGLGIGAFGL